MTSIKTFFSTAQDDELYQAFLHDERVVAANKFVVAAHAIQWDDGKSLRVSGGEAQALSASLHGLLAELDGVRTRLSTRVDTFAAAKYVALRQSKSDATDRVFTEEDAKQGSRNLGSADRTMLASADGARVMLLGKVKAVDKIGGQIEVNLRSITAEIRSLNGV